MRNTKDALLIAGRQIFAQQGFKGATIRGLAAAANVNLGAITYHFGSKADLYNAVIETVTAPIRDRLAKPIPPEIAPLDRIEAFLRATFAFLGENPDVPRLVLQQLVSGGALPPAARETLRLNLEKIMEFIEAGQQHGSIRSGDPRNLAMSVAGQPMLLAIYRKALSETIHLNQDDPRTRQSLVDSVVAFVRGGLTAPRTAS